MGRHQENPVRLYFLYDPISNKSRCQIDGCTAEIAGNHGGNLQRHVQRMHPSAFATLQAIPKMEDPSVPSPSTSKRPLSSVDGQRMLLDPVPPKQARQERIQISPDALIDACVELVTVNGRSFSLLDDSGFRKILDPVLMAMGHPIAIDGSTVCAMVSEVAEREREKLRNRLKGKLLMLKVDVATRKGRSVLGINVQYAEGEHILLLTLGVRELHERHTDSSVSVLVREVLKVYGIDLKQVYSITVDDASSMQTVLERQEKEIEQECCATESHEEKGDRFVTVDIYETSGNVCGELHDLGSGGPILRGIRCSAHIFQLAVEEALSDSQVSDFIAKARRVSQKLCTPNVSGFLRRLGHKMVAVDRPNQWLSTHDMLEGLCVLKTFCEDMAPTVPELHLEETEWGEINHLVWALKPAKMTTKLLLFEQITAGDFFGLWLKCKIETDKVGGPFATLLVECLNRRQQTLFENEAFTAAVFLDPRYRVLLNETQVKQAKMRLCRAWGMMQALAANAAVPPAFARALVESGDNDADDEIEEMLRARERESGDEGIKCKTSMMAMLNAYSSEERLKREENIFRYWFNTSVVNPDLYRLALSVIPLPVTQVSVERVLSGLEYILREGTGMSNDILEDVLFVRLNKQFGMQAVDPRSYTV